MYTVDDQDRVIKLDDIPQCSIGAPCPLVLTSEYALIVAYLMDDADPSWDGRSIRVVGPSSPGEPAAVVRFTRALASMLGPPNDEAFAGHPLAKRGLHPYGAFEVQRSSWIRRLERMNSVHPYHRPEHYATFRHFILTFHDSTFECVASGYTFEITSGSLTELIAQTARDLTL